MKKTSSVPRRSGFRLGLSLPMIFLAGCCCGGGHSLKDKCADITPGALPQPPGAHVREFQTRQVLKAEKDYFVIYLYEWLDATTDLGPFGARHVEQIALRLPNTPHGVVIEPDADPKVNEARLLALINVLAGRGVTDARNRVTVGYPQAEGLYGDEAERIYRQMISPQNINNANGSRGGNFGSQGGGGNSRGFLGQTY